MRYHLALAAALAMQVSAARAESIVALVGEDILATIDSRTAKTTGLVKIDGVGPVLGIDVRPADGQLYALARDGTIATIDPTTGKATAKSKLDKLPPEDFQIAVDFNPAADKMRIIGADGTNLRADVDSGKVTEDQSLRFAANDPAAGRTPAIVAGAYSNSVKGAKETTLYDIDVLGGLFRQAPPNDGVLNTIGTIGVSIDRIGFDILADAAGTNTGMLVANGKLYMLDLTTGKAAGGRSIVGLPSDVRDIAVLPSSPAKEATNMMTGDGMRNGAEMPSGYLTKSMPGNPSRPMRMGTMNSPQNSQYRVNYQVQTGAYAAAKRARMRGPQCHERGAQY
jgi:Domain of unknown function (DUF4394)